MRRNGDALGSGIRYYRCRIKKEKLKKNERKRQISKYIKDLDFHKRWNGTYLTAVLVIIVGVL